MSDSIEVDGLEVGPAMVRSWRQELSEFNLRERQAFGVLQMFGIPEERARSVANGIQVFDARMQKEVTGLKAGIERLELALINRNVCPTCLKEGERISVDEGPDWFRCNSCGPTGDRHYFKS